MANHSITDEQLDSLESEYMTTDTIRVITTAARTTTAPRSVVPTGSRTLLHIATKLLDDIAGQSGDCLLHKGRNGSVHGFCSAGCPGHKFAPDVPGCYIKLFVNECKGTLQMGE